jgi:hypothetical protein
MNVVLNLLHATFFFSELDGVLDDKVVIVHHAAYSEPAMWPRQAISIGDCAFVYSCEGGACLRETDDPSEPYSTRSFCARYSSIDDLPGTYEPTFCAGTADDQPTRAACAAKCGCFEAVRECCEDDAATTCHGMYRGDTFPPSCVGEPKEYCEARMCLARCPCEFLCFVFCMFLLFAHCFLHTKKRHRRV